jgi:hypothetical protein
MTRWRPEADSSRYTRRNPALPASLPIPTFPGRITEDCKPPAVVCRVRHGSYRRASRQSASAARIAPVVPSDEPTSRWAHPAQRIEIGATRQFGNSKRERPQSGQDQTAIGKNWAPRLAHENLTSVKTPREPGREMALRSAVARARTSARPAACYNAGPPASTQREPAEK